MRVVAVAAGVVPEVVCLSASASPAPVAIALDPVAVAPDPVAVLEAAAKSLGETRGVASSAGAVSFLAASAARLAASTHLLRVRLLIVRPPPVILPHPLPKPRPPLSVQWRQGKGFPDVTCWYLAYRCANCCQSKSFSSKTSFTTSFL